MEPSIVDTVWLYDRINKILPIIANLSGKKKMVHNNNIWRINHKAPKPSMLDTLSPTNTMFGNGKNASLS